MCSWISEYKVSPLVWVNSAGDSSIPAYLYVFTFIIIALNSRAVTSTGSSVITIVVTYVVFF
jgi:hypothetical protein